jgi:hypothetical protein
VTATATQATPSQEAVMNVLLRHSLAWQMIGPIPLAVIVAIAAIWILVPHMIMGNATDQAVLASRNIAAQFKTIREYYTENVVDKVVMAGTFNASFDHKGDPKAIPLPVTMNDDQSLQQVPISQPRESPARCL